MALAEYKNIETRSFQSSPNPKKPLLDLATISNAGLVALSGRNVKRVITEFGGEVRSTSFRDEQKAMNACRQICVGDSANLSQPFLLDVQRDLRRKAESLGPENGQWNLIRIDSGSEGTWSGQVPFHIARTGLAAASSALSFIEIKKGLADHRGTLIESTRESTSELIKFAKSQNAFDRNKIADQLGRDIVRLEQCSPFGVAVTSTPHGYLWDVLGDVWSAEPSIAVQRSLANFHRGNLALDFLRDYSAWVGLGFTGLVAALCFGLDPGIGMAVGAASGVALSVLNQFGKSYERK